MRIGRTHPEPIRHAILQIAHTAPCLKSRTPVHHAPLAIEKIQLLIISILGNKHYQLK